MSKDVINREGKFGANHYERLNFVVGRASGIYLYNKRGVPYIDLLGAYSAANQGHHHPKIVKALIKAAQDKTFGVISNVVYTPLLAEFLERVANMLPQLGHHFGDKGNKVLPKNGGVESVETAIKAMRKWGYKSKYIPDGEQEIIVFRNNFHGRTSMIVSASSTEKYRDGFRAMPKNNGFVFVDFGDVKGVEKAINQNTCGILVEPMQGEGGMNIPPDDFLQGLRTLADKHNLFLVFDEIQVGLGRTGKMFAFEHYGVVPDGIILAKALSGGLIPVSVFVTNKYLMDYVFTPGTDGSTYGGYPGACAVSMAALDVIRDEKLVENSAKMGNILKSKLQALAKKIPRIKEVRGKGLFIGIELNGGGAWDVCKELLKHHIVANDSHGNVIRISPPLIIRKENINDIVSALEKVLQ